MFSTFYPRFLANISSSFPIILVEFKIALSCYIDIWFVIGLFSAIINFFDFTIINFRKINFGGGPGWLILESNGKVRVRIQDDSALKVTTFDTDIGDNTLHHVTVVFDRTNNEIRTYIDGVKEVTTMDISTISGSVDNSQSLTLGGSGPLGQNVNGILDEVKIILDALEDSEI